MTRLILEELARRKAARAAVEGQVSAILGELFDKQRAVYDDPNKTVATLCTRRAGKTELSPRLLVIGALVSGALCQFWAISRLRAKQLVWKHLKDLNARHALNGSFNETELTVNFPNGGEIRLLGADKEKETHKKRGDKCFLVIIDEAQLFDAFLKGLVEDVIEPSLSDLRGKLVLMGTPGPICAGLWHEVSGGNDVDSRWMSGGGWSVHRWSAWDNPHVQHLRQDWLELKRRRRWADDNPTWMREYMGRWVNDLGALFYKFDPNRNVYEPGVDGPEPWGPGWQHVLGWDLGYRDDMAIVVWGWHPDHPNLYEAYSWKEKGALSDKIMEQIRNLESRGFNLIRKFADTGGGGRLFVEEVVHRYGEAFEAAKKTEKYEHVRLLNDELLSGFIKLQKGSPLQVEMATLARDLDWPPPERSELTPPREDPRCPNHCCDAGLYAYRGAWHYLFAEKASTPAHGTEAHWQKEAARLEDGVKQRAEQFKQQHWMDRDITDAEWWEDA